MKNNFCIWYIIQSVIIDAFLITMSISFTQLNLSSYNQYTSFPIQLTFIFAQISPMSTPQQIIGQFIRNLFKINRQNMFEVPIPNPQVLTSNFKISVRNAELNKLETGQVLQASADERLPEVTEAQSVTRRECGDVCGIEK
jgi:hypothetical protein